MKRLWIYRSDANIIDNCEAKGVIVGSIFGDGCAICKSKLESTCCTERFTNFYKCSTSFNLLSTNVVEHAKQLLFTLLMLKNRQSTLFYVLDYSIISKIFTFASSGIYGGLSGMCSIVKLPCRHVYHMHCLTLWRARRSTCPLCDYPISDVVTYKDNRVSNTTISQILVTGKSYDEIYAEKLAQQYGIDAKLVSILKHTPEGATLESLCEIMARSADLIGDKLAVLEQRGYVRYDAEKQLYYYD